MTRGRLTPSKVPAITLTFWVLKLLTTALGESTSDTLVNHFAPIPVVLVTGVIFVVVLAWQFTRPRYDTLAYWGAVVLVGIFGTMVADSIHVALHVPYLASSIAFAVALGVLFATWYRVEGTLSIHDITSSSREAFYWATVCATFALGTALGDLTAFTFHLGFLTSTVLFGVLFALPGLAFAARRIGAISSFWASYVLTRPLGASVADWIGKPHSAGGMGFTAFHMALVLAVVFLTTLLLTWRRERAQGSVGWR